MGQSQPAKDETIITWLAEDKVRTDTGEDTSIIILPKQNVMLMVNHGNMTYTETPLNTKDIIGAMMQGQGEQSEEQKKAMEMVQQMAQGLMANIEAKVTETGETKKIRNWNCRRYIIEISMSMGKSTSEAWATEDVKIDPRLYWMSANAMMAAQQGFEKVMQEMHKIKGMVVYQETKSQVMGAEVKMVEEVVEISNKAAPAGIFDVSAGYKKSMGMGR